MLKKILFLFILATCSGPVPPLGAEEKIALVNLQKALNEVEEGKKAKAAIQADMDGKKKELEALKGALGKMKGEFEKQQSVLSKETIASKTNEMQAKFMELQQKAMQYEQELKTKEETSVKNILTNLRLKVSEVAKEKGYTLVFENSADVVLYSRGVDITADVIALFNKK